MSDSQDEESKPDEAQQVTIEEIETANIRKYCNDYGNCRFIGMKSSDKPMMVIGPQWKYYTLMMLSIAIITSIIYWRLFRHYLPLAMKVFYWLVVLGEMTIYTAVFICNPGIILKTMEMGDNEFYCQKCKGYIKNDVKSRHCSICDVCVEDWCHHCVWIGKCVGRTNKRLFQLLIGFSFVCYAYIGYCFYVTNMNYNKTIGKGGE